MTAIDQHPSAIELFPVVNYVYSQRFEMFNVDATICKFESGEVVRIGTYVLHGRRTFSRYQLEGHFEFRGQSIRVIGSQQFYPPGMGIWSFQSHGGNTIGVLEFPRYWLWFDCWSSLVLRLHPERENHTFHLANPRNLSAGILGYFRETNQPNWTKYLLAISGSGSREPTLLNSENGIHTMRTDEFLTFYAGLFCFVAFPHLINNS